MIWHLLLLSTAVCYLFYRWVTRSYDFFEKRGIAYHKSFPILGVMKDALLRRKSAFYIFKELYEAHEGSTYGFFDQRAPQLMIRDPEMIKQITIKEFDHFVNHRPLFQADANNVFSGALFNMRDDKWRDMRNTLSPAFTGSKMRQMFQLIDQVASNSITYLQETQSKSGQELDMKDFATRFTNDVIASTAFGLQVNSIQERNNDFYMMGKQVTNFTAWSSFKFWLSSNFGTLSKLLNIEVFDKRSIDYFSSLVFDTMKYRLEHNIQRPDMINLLMEARGMIPAENSKNALKRDWSDLEILSQCFVFFFAGFETSATLICFAAHELMENPEVQAKLLQEIMEVSEALKGQPLTYEALQGMKYMDMVVSETLRKWPPALVTDRMCTKDFVCKSDGRRLEIKRGERISIPIVGLHYDPAYYPKPEMFDPERFSDERKANINQSTYLPFGAGPRSCIASRFALLEAKASLFHLLRTFRIAAAKGTNIPLKMSPSTFNLLPESGFQLKLIPRK